MKAYKIEEILNTLKVNSRGAIRGKNQAINKLQAEIYKEQDNILMDIRIAIAKLQGDNNLLKQIDDIIYNKSTAL